MVEFTIVAPVLLLLGLAILQYSLLYVAKNQINHAAFMATRAGSMHNATAQSISTAYLRSLAPLYGGGGNATEVAAAVGRATADMQGNYRIELINPSKASFSDFNDPALQAVLRTSARVIPNAGLAMRDPSVIKTASKQNIFDANLIKVRITHGYHPGVLMVSKVFATALLAADDGSDAFVSKQLAAGRVPISTDITLHMNSDAIEWANPVWISPPPTDQKSDPPQTQAPPDQPVDKEPDHHPAPPPDKNTDPGTGTSNDTNTGGACGDKPCPICKADIPASESFPFSADVLFDFDQSALKPDGLDELDSLIEDAKQAQNEGQGIASVVISGYTDQLGSDAVNLPLSRARAQAVRDYMLQHGFPDVPVTVRGMGAADPAVALSNCAGDGQAQKDCLAPNRRVVVEIRRAAPQASSGSRPAGN